MQKLGSRQVREEARHIRQDIIKMLSASGSGHTGGSLSCADILATLYFNVLQHEPKDPAWQGRDKFVMSKGHAAPALYATLARAGYFPNEELLSLRKPSSRLQGHPSKSDLPFLECSTGSLGQGISVAVGLALGAKIDKETRRIYCLMGDGEQQEGSVWEAAMSASHFKLDNLCAIIDLNQLQIDGSTKDVMNIEPLAKKYKAFGWRVIKANGHNINSLLRAFRKCMRTSGRPSVIIARTIKGKGVSFMENDAEWHGKAPNKIEAEQALKELLEN